MKKPILFLLFILAVFLCSCGRTTEIDLTNYIHYDISGLNGTGKMFLSVDELLYSDAAKKNEKLSLDTVRRIIERDVALSAARDRLLFNGDEIVIEVSCVCSEEDQKAAGIRLITGSKTVTVTGLPEPREIDLTQDLLVDVQGFEGGGTLTARFAEKLYNTIADLSRDMTTEKARELLQASVPVTADKDSGLSDGDTVTITVDASDANAAFAEQGLVLKGGKVSHTVNGLKALTHFRASDYVSYTLTGTAPYLTVEFRLSDKVPQELVKFFTLPAGRRVTFRKGETREFELRYNEAELKSRGYVCDEASFTVSPDGFGLEKYLEELSEISASEMQKIKDETADSAYAAAVYETKHLTYHEGDVFGDTVEKISLLSTMLFIRRYYSDSAPFNYLVLIYRADYSLTSGYNNHDTEMYVMLTFENVKLDPSGNVIFEEPAEGIMLSESLETEIDMLKADHELEEIREKEEE